MKRRIYDRISGKPQAASAARWHVRHLHAADERSYHNGTIWLRGAWGRRKDQKLVLALLPDNSRAPVEVAR